MNNLREPRQTEALQETIQRYFQERNKSWVTGELAGVVQAARVKDNVRALQVLSQPLKYKQREVGARRSRIFRAHTQVVIQQLEHNAEDGGIDAIVDECVTWVYQDRPDYGVESRGIRHWQKWVYEDGHWKLAADVASDERRTADAEAAVFPTVPDGHAGGVWGDGFRAPCTTYDRVRAYRYSELWWNGFNPRFVKFVDDDCTNFISQCILAGGFRMTGGQNRASGWWYRFSGTSPNGNNWSYSWAMSNALYQYLVNKGGANVVSSARELKVGDLILYDWNGTGRFGHSVIVVDFDGRGDPLVNAHTVPSWHRHYRYLDSPAWTSRTRYAYLHLPDQLC
ncbi:amidase domain-containing protein [Alicyclobacillus cycloheptanicus]|uniref:Putative amidase domain-containing protein n=1 Tax=Alicyclobacillus cycloheptanicus TaxID=1457 RepID=A0ABT9XKC2_9BACL|nr:amidase domain-containing protein [Alicyclobacillus cycloheptanicus]MDQ0190738.1 hypothetical protein [Alicyclobacillus cycloheptanicus]WDL99871.1 amidase domain-containing protein [Alicyclobacillus cycloheptanicus]